MRESILTLVLQPLSRPLVTPSSGLLKSTILTTHTAPLDGKPRCHWSNTAPEFIEYHDAEWGFPVGDDRLLFEKLCLEGFQSGLSWRTIYNKRERFRSVFHQFDFDRIAAFSAADVERLMQDPGIVRHRGKIEAVLNNALKAQEMVEREGSLAHFFWRYEPKAPSSAAPQSASTSPESVAMSKELKRRGWKFVGPTTMYAFMQAMGIINDHAHHCFSRAASEQARQAFQRPAR